MVFRLNKTEKRHRLNGHGGAGYPFDPSQPGTWDAVETRRYVWDGYNIAAEIVINEATPSTNVTYYTWGLDLSGTLQGAGGVGGLLAVTTADLDQPDSLTTYYPCYDANGNITDYIGESGLTAAHYEYSPFGEIVVKSGNLADAFLFRFSTKPFEGTTGLVMYQLRPYEPGLGRWLCRDPIDEVGFEFLRLVSGISKKKYQSIVLYLQRRGYTDAEINEILVGVQDLEKESIFSANGYDFVWNQTFDVIDPLGDAPEWLKRLKDQIKNAVSYLCPSPGGELVGAAECGPGLTFLVQQAKLQEELLKALERGDFQKVEELEIEIRKNADRVLNDISKCAKQKCCNTNRLSNSLKK